MSQEEVYALLKAKIDKISASSIGDAVTAFLTENPDYFLDLLGLYKDGEGYICQAAEAS